MCHLQHPQFAQLFVMQRTEESVDSLAEVKHQYRQAAAQCFSAPREPHRGTCCCCVHGGRGSLLLALILAFLFTGYLPWAIAHCPYFSFLLHISPEPVHIPLAKASRDPLLTPPPIWTRNQEMEFDLLTSQEPCDFQRRVCRSRAIHSRWTRSRIRSQEAAAR